LLKNLKPSSVQAVLVTVVFSTLLFMNQAALLPTLIICAFIFVFVSASRIPLIIGSLFSLPFLLLFYQIALPTGSPVFEPGYLSTKPFAFLSFLQFWIHNLGLHLLFIPLGIVLIKKPYRWLVFPLLIIFIVPNLFRLSTDMINNHKLINFFMIFGGIYAALAIAQLFSKNTHSLLKVFIVPILFLLTFSGILDFLVIKNDYHLTLDDLPKNKDATFIALATQPRDVILNSTWFYHPASLAGRSIYNGYAFFTWSAGYDTYQREAVVKDIYRSEDQVRVCQLLSQEKISYVELNRQPDEYIQPISTLWKTMSPVFYDNQASGIKLFKVEDICHTN
jgi:hypothetical protein